MSLQRLIINTGSLTAAGFKSKVNLASGPQESAISLSEFIAALPAGFNSSLLSLNTGAVQASFTITQTSTGAANTETLVVCGVTFTARTSGATGNEWNRSNTVATSATNLAAAINASVDVNIYVSAASAAGVVTVTALVPGVLGNLGITGSDACANTSTSAVSGGSDGTAHSIDLR